MRVHVFETLEAQAQGLQHLRAIDPETLYVFPVVSEDVEFHSRNVPEPFDIAFLTERYFVMAVVRMTPTADVVRVPAGASLAFEAKAGNLARWGITPGRIVSPLEE